MSNYKNFIQDFPIRCGKIFKEYNKQAKQDRLEVTHMLSIASVAITIPLERLKIPKDNIEHPSYDRKIYQSASEKFLNLCDNNFLKSKLWNGDDNFWKKGKVSQDIVNNEPESWVTNAKPLPTDYKVKYFLNHIRNSIAHGNIYTSSDKDDKIVDMIFLNRIYKDNVFTGEYNFLIVSVSGFNIFLNNWIKYFTDEVKLDKIE